MISWTTVAEIYVFRRYFEMLHVNGEACQCSRLLEAAKVYEELVDLSMLADEYERWAIHCQTNIPKPLPTTAIAALQFCSNIFFANINILLRIAATPPSSSASAERSFSALKLLKTHIRSTTKEERLCGLAHLYYLLILTGQRSAKTYWKSSHCPNGRLYCDCFVTH